MATEQELLDHLKWMTTELRQARARVHELESRAPEPIAVVGMACRFPGGISTPEALWQLVVEGREAIGEVPPGRNWDARPWYHPDPEHPGTSYVRHGGFIDDADLFDAPFFGISPREALAMDPQQRLLLETSWEAFEYGGLNPNHYRGKPVGVFTGLAYAAYGTVGHTSVDEVEGHVLTGSSPAVASGRIAYTMGFEGPAVSIDTMCSSSLVAIHLAVQSLRQGECATALAAGAAVIAEPAEFIEFSRQRALSPDGRCRPFSASADGTGWAEGVGVLLLEPLSTARREGHPVHAVIRGSAINQDGASNGLTAPNRAAQQRVLTSALDAAGLTAADIDLVEAHGTGTTLGDPIELSALQAVYGRGRRPGSPLHIGSVKSNIGHAQAASGLAGVIKSVMALRHGLMPPTLHAAEPTGEFDWSAGSLALLTEPRPWPAGEHPRRAGISSFGASGTNAHVVLEQAAPPETTTEPPAPAASVPAAPWPLSATGPAALGDQAARIRASLTASGTAAGPRAARIGRVLADRTAFPERAVLIGDEGALPGELAKLRRGEPSDTVVTGTATGDGRVVFVFPGQGSQWHGMAVALLDTSPVFAEAIAECEKALAPHVDWSLTNVLRDGEPSLDRVDVVQPTLWAVNIALSALWASYGVRPDAVIGHSQGEIVAACVAGALSLQDAAGIVALRSRLVAEHLAGQGTMASVLAPADAVRERIAELRSPVAVAAENGPASVVVSGDADAVREFLEQMPSPTRTINVDYASHTAHVDIIRDPFLSAAGETRATASEVQYYSTVTGAVLDTTALDTGYWWRNLRETVQFQQAVRAAMADGHSLFIEVSAHPVLTGSIADIAGVVESASVDTADTPRAHSDDIAVVGTLRRDEDDLHQFLAALARAWVKGAPVDWTAAYTGRAVDPEAVPTYAFQRERFWLDRPPGETAAGTLAPEFWQALEEQDADAVAAAVGASDAQRDALITSLPVLADWRRHHERHEAIRSWGYRSAWVRPHQTLAEPLSGSWLILAPADPLADEAAAACRDALSDQHVQVRDIRLDAAHTNRHDLADLLRRSVLDEPVDGILSLLPLTGGAAPTLALLQAVTDLHTPVALWTVTSGAVPAEPDDAPDNDGAAQVWGLGRVAALEHPDVWAGLIDLPAVPDPAVLRHLPAILTGAAQEDQWALRPAGPLVHRVVAAPSPDTAAPWRPHGTVLVTGATGHLGGEVARWLAASGADELVLTTRHEPRNLVALRDELAAHGTTVTVVTCDLRHRDEVLALAERLGRDHPPVTAVFHAAGPVDLRPLADTPSDGLTDELAARVNGAEHLDEAFPDVARMVFFSTVTGLWGAADHGAYAAAGVSLDALARRRRDRGRSATSVAWGVWGIPGTEDRTEPVEGEPDPSDGVPDPARQGLPPLEPARALAALGQLLAEEHAVVAMADVRWDRFLPLYTVRRSTRLFDEIPQARDAATAPDTASLQDDTSSELLDRLAAAGPEERTDILLGVVREHCAATLGHPSPDAVVLTTSFQMLGFDSVMSIDLRNRLTAATGTRMRPGLIFDFPTPRQLAEHLATTLLAAEGDGPDSVESAIAVLESHVAAGQSAVWDPSAIERVERVVSALREGQPLDGSSSAAVLDEATDLELFEYIHNELGRPSSP